MDLSFVVHNLEKFSAKSGKLNFEGLVHLLRYIRDNNTLGLEYYANINDAPVSDLLRQASIKNENLLMDFSDSSWQDYPDTGRGIGAYIIFYQVGPIDHDTHVPGLVSQPSAERKYNAACTAGMYLEYFRILIHELLNKDPEIVLE